jgi:HEAT repeat protein
MSEPDPVDIKQFLAELRDVNKDKRRTAVMKLGLAGGDLAINALIMAVQNRNEDLIVRGRAALMLGKLGDTRAVLPLIKALDAPGLQTPLYAAQALGKLGDDRAIKPLLDMASSPDDKLRNAALESLERLGYSKQKEVTDPEAR